MTKLRIFLGYFILIIISLSMLLPFFAMLSLSFMPGSEIFSYPPKLFSKNITVQNYFSVFTSIPVTRYFLNSLFVATITTIGQVFFAALAGYAFARLKFKGKDILFFIFLITMMIPPQVNIIPLFFLMRELHLVDTYQALIIPGFFGGFGVFMLRQYFLNLPKELEESSKIDGCNIFQMFFKIALPLALPAVATLAIFTFVSSWNSFMWPLIITSSDSMRTLPVGLAAFKGSFREVTMWGDLLACAVICTLPVVGIFLLGKKYFINDLLQGGVKE
ncbi:MAG TPA: carbohydrate ABC transporter permease [Candidatus Gastranaerophilaceae bacterium]|nr:carbohydrate ABC transporter permease [Candidatus Gastranaerophilaceae bacterium]